MEDAEAAAASPSRAPPRCPAGSRWCWPRTDAALSPDAELTRGCQADCRGRSGRSVGDRDPVRGLHAGEARVLETLVHLGVSRRLQLGRPLPASPWGAPPPRAYPSGRPTGQLHDPEGPMEASAMDVADADSASTRDSSASAPEPGSRPRSSCRWTPAQAHPWRPALRARPQGSDQADRRDLGPRPHPAQGVSFASEAALRDQSLMTNLNRDRRVFINTRPPCSTSEPSCDAAHPRREPRTR